MAFRQLLCHFGLGGDKWITQFIFSVSLRPAPFLRKGFPRYRTSDRARVPLFRKSPSKRFKERARASDRHFSQEHWGDAMGQAASGWLSEPSHFRMRAIRPFVSLGPSDAAFRFAVAQYSKLRPCDDLRRNLTNVRTAILTPITLPTWDRLSEISKAIYHTFRGWAFIKGGHASAYKQLPLDPPHANLTVVALRHPQTNLWMASFIRLSFSGLYRRFYIITAFPAA